LSKSYSNDFLLPHEYKAWAIAKIIVCSVTGLVPMWLTTALATKATSTRRPMPHQGRAVSLPMMFNPRTLRSIKAPLRAEACLPSSGRCSTGLRQCRRFN
jgi:hypothetical protein